MSSVKTSPKRILEMAKNVYPKLVAAEQKNCELFKAIKTSATGNKGKSYWSGASAFKWYCNAVKNCANNHYRIYKLAAVYKKLCSSAYELEFKDKSGSSSIAGDLNTKAYQFGDLMNDCEKNRNTAINWGKS